MTKVPTISDIIEAFLKDLIAQENPIEIQRNELAKYFQCAPSQINYVLTTRFSPEQGYATESQRGGGGYIKIKRLTFTPGQGAYYIITKEIGDRLSRSEAYRIIEFLLHEKWITAREATLMKGALDDKAFSFSQGKDLIRAGILKGMLAILLE